MGRATVTGGTAWPAADETLSDCEAPPPPPPGTLTRLGVLPGLELVRYTIPVPVRGMGLEKPGVVGVVGAVEGVDETPGRVGPDATRVRCWSWMLRLYVRTCPGLCGSSPGWMGGGFIDWESRRGRGVLATRGV